MNTAPYLPSIKNMMEIDQSPQPALKFLEGDTEPKEEMGG